MILSTEIKQEKAEQQQNQERIVAIKMHPRFLQEMRLLGQHTLHQYNDMEEDSVD